VRALNPAAIEVRGLRAGGWLRRPSAGRLLGIDLSVPVGARLLLISRPEGAASLLLRTLAGTVRPAAGSIALAGVRRPDESPLGWGRRVAYSGARAAPYDWLSPIEALSLAARLVGLTSDERRSRVEELVVRFRLASDAKRPIRRAGPAVAQKVALAAALVGEPEVLLLDEPLGSVDPYERRSLLHLGSARTTILLASRYPAGDDGLVDRVALIRDGRVALQAGVDDLAAASLPLSVRGIEALADRKAGVPADSAP
jgi:ABC-type multidrug transport system ATPase subunit